MFLFERARQAIRAILEADPQMNLSDIQPDPKGDSTLYFVKRLQETVINAMQCDFPRLWGPLEGWIQERFQKELDAAVRPSLGGGGAVSGVTAGNVPALQLPPAAVAAASVPAGEADTAPPQPPPPPLPPPHCSRGGGGGGAAVLGGTAVTDDGGGGGTLPAAAAATGGEAAEAAAVAAAAAAAAKQPPAASTAVPRTADDGARRATQGGGAAEASKVAGGRMPTVAGRGVAAASPSPAIALPITQY